MASNSFYLKGWTITLISAFIGLRVGTGNHLYLTVALVPVLLFWVLDGYYLRQEKLYRKLYDHVRATEGDDTDFSMDTHCFKHMVDNWILTCFNKTLFMFYGSFTIILLILLARFGVVKK